MLRLLPCLLLVTFACTSHAAEHFDGKTWWATVQVISDDKYEGRDTGSKGERQAQEYIVGKLKGLGVEPAGDHGFYQSVKLRSLEIEESHSQLALVKDGAAQK